MKVYRYHSLLKLWKYFHKQTTMSDFQAAERLSLFTPCHCQAAELCGEKPQDHVVHPHRHRDLRQELRQTFSSFGKLSIITNILSMNLMVDTIHSIFQVCQRDFANELINRVIAPNVDVSTAIQDKVS